MYVVQIASIIFLSRVGESTFYRDSISAIKYVGLKRKTKIHIAHSRRRPGAELRGRVVSSEEHCKLSPVLMVTYMPVLFVGLARIPSVILSGTKLHHPPRLRRTQAPSSSLCLCTRYPGIRHYRCRLRVPLYLVRPLLRLLQILAISVSRNGYRYLNV